MKTIIRNFLSVLRRFKMATILNVLGLSVAFAAFMVIMMQVQYERSFDKCHPTAENVFRVTLQKSSDIFSVIFPRGFVEELIHSSPHIKAGTLLTAGFPNYFTYQENDEKHGIKESLRICSPDIVKVFGFPFIEGDPGCLNEPDNVIIPESMAKRLFGNQGAVGKNLHAEEPIWTKSQTQLVVGAVYRDFPENTQLDNCIYTAINAGYQLTNFGSSNYTCYLLLDEPFSAKLVEENFNKKFDFSKIDEPEEQIGLTPLTDIYYLNEGLSDMVVTSGSRDTTYLLLFIAMLIIIVAVINYVNFSTALTPVRIKSINTQKVLGNPSHIIRISIISEAVIISVFAWLLGLFIVYALNKLAVMPFVSANMDFSVNAGILFLSGGIALIAGIIAGIYPASYITSFPPALVLKGSFGLSASGRKLRTALIGFQFVVSIILIIGASLMQLQNTYMRDYTLGFDKDQVAIVELGTDIYDKYHEVYANRLKEYPGITDVAFSMEKLASQDSYNTSTSEYKGKSFQYFMFPVSYNFLRVMGIPVVAGRNFSHADEKSNDATYIFNRFAHESMEMEVGDLFENWLPGRIAGFTEDVKFSSLRKGNDHVAFVVENQNYPSLPVSYIRLEKGINVHDAVSHIHKTLSEIDANYPFEVEFYDTIFDQLYHKEVNLRSLVSLLSLIAIILSLVGVFGLVVFDTQYRKKEIAIRKIYGSTISQILEMLNRQYVSIVCVCSVIAIPVAYVAIKKWQENFAYKTPLYW